MITDQSFWSIFKMYFFFSCTKVEYMCILNRKTYPWRMTIYFYYCVTAKQATLCCHQSLSFSSSYSWLVWDMSWIIEVTISCSLGNNFANSSLLSIYQSAHSATVETEKDVEIIEDSFLKHILCDENANMLRNSWDSESLVPMCYESYVCKLPFLAIMFQNAVFCTLGTYC